MSHTIDLKAGAKAAGIGGVAAGAVCVAIYFAAAAMGADFKPKDPQAMGGMEVLPFFQPMLNCVIAAVVSIGLMALLVKLTGPRAWPIFVVVAVVVFVVELYMPFWAFADMKTIAALEIMHVPATLGVVGGFFTARRPVG